MMAKPIRRKPQLFVHCYLACRLNGAEAAREAGYSRKNARHYASRLLRKANVREYLAIETKAMFDRYNAKVRARAMEEYQREAERNLAEVLARFPQGKKSQRRKALNTP